MSTIIKIEGEEVQYSPNGSEIFSAATSGYIGFVGEVARQYGGQHSKTVSVIFKITDGVITGSFDATLNPSKEIDNIVGSAVIGMKISDAGAFIGRSIAKRVVGGVAGGFAAGSTAGPVGSVIGAIAGGVLGGIYGDDIYDGTEKLLELLAEKADPHFSFLNEKIYGEMSQDEFYVKELERGNICAKHYPEYLRYRQLTTIDTFPSVLHSDIRQILSYDKESQKAYIKVTDEVTLKEFADLVLQNNKEVREIVINDKLYNMQNENDKATISALQTEHNRLLDEKKEQSAQTANTQQEIQNETSNNEINADNAVQTSDNQQPQTPPISLSYTTPLVYKDFNDKVGELQRGLNFLKEAGEISWDKYLEEDNYFGDETKEALIEFQRANSLKESGNADKTTIEALQQKIEHFTPKGKISSDMENFLKQQLGIDEFSDGFKSALAYFQENYSLDDNEIKDMTLNPLVTDEFIEQLAKEQEASEEAEAKRKQEREQEEDNLHYHSYRKS